MSYVLYRNIQGLMAFVSHHTLGTGDYHWTLNGKPMMFSSLEEANNFKQNHVDDDPYLARAKVEGFDSQSEA